MNGQTQLFDPYNFPSVDKPFTPIEVLEGYKSTFDSHYSGNNAPFGVYMHPVWVGSGIPPSIPNGDQKYKAVSDFLDYAMSRPNVWMVTYSQLIEYMKNPVSASQLGSQPYMQCNQPSPPTEICNGLGFILMILIFRSRD